jgi:hypothetical protein
MRFSEQNPIKSEMFPFSKKDFVSKYIHHIGKIAYERQLVKKHCTLYALVKCSSLEGFEIDANGKTISFNVDISLSHIPPDLLREELIENVKSLKEREKISFVLGIQKQLMNSLDPEKQCLMYLRQEISLPNYYWRDSHHSGCDIVQFPVPLSRWYESNFTKIESRQKNTNQPSERELETELLSWLEINGIETERQVTTKNNHRLDLWIPGQIILELKKSKVTGDDICQAIDYYATYSRSIVIVGKGMSDAASRGIEAFNKAMKDDCLVFITWATVKPYLKAILT